MRYARSKEKRRGRQGGPLRKACLLSAESVLWICEAAFASTTSSMLAAAIAGLYTAQQRGRRGSSRFFALGRASRGRLEAKKAADTATVTVTGRYLV